MAAPAVQRNWEQQGSDQVCDGSGPDPEDVAARYLTARITLLDRPAPYNRPRPPRDVRGHQILSGSWVSPVSVLALLFSSRAILVSERIEDATLHQQLVCTYFNGSGTMTKEYWYSKSDTFGRAACPRLETVREAE
jgi:hypothetical protein